MVRAWAGFEALAQDLWEEAINNGSRSFRDRCFDKAGGKEVRLEDLKRHNFDMSHSLGSHLSPVFSFKKVDGVIEAYNRAFGWTKVAPDIVYYHHLSEAEQARHCIVHRGGVADQEYIKKAPNKGLKVGDEIGFEYEEVLGSISIITHESLNLAVQLFHMLETHDPVA